MLTTVFLYNQFTGVPVTSDERIRLEDLITQISDLIEKKCGRAFETSTHKKWIDGNGQSTLFLPNYPITKIKRVAGCTNHAITAQNAGNDVATLSANVSAISLTTIDSVGSETETDLYYANYANATSMATAIDLLSGWTASTVTMSTGETSLMQYTKPLYAEDALDEVYIELAGSNMSIRLADDSNNGIEAKCGYFPCGKSNIYVEWVGGYTLPVDNDQHSALSVEGDLPKGLTLTVNKIAKDIITAVQEDTNMNEEIIGDYEYKRSDVASVVDRYWDDLSEWAYVNP